MAKRTFYAAKINVHENIFSQDLDKIIEYEIPKTIMESKTIKLKSWNWTFTDINQIIHQGRKIIFGNVTKSKYKQLKVRIDTVTTNVISEHELAYTAFFIYDLESEILAHESTSSISVKEFLNLFTYLLSQNPVIGEVIIKSITEDQFIRKELLSIQKVTQIQFHLIHPNPGRRKSFNLYQKMIHQNRLKSLDIKMTNKDGVEIIEEQLDFKNDSEKDTSTTDQHSDTSTHEKHESSNTTLGKKLTTYIEYGIQLVESGYGEIKIKGFDETIRKGKTKNYIDKKPRNFSSENSIRRINVTEDEPVRLRSKLVTFILNVIKKNM
ncbi:hypothetical protein GOP56_19950 [Brevibacillus sp. 7WMA2]|uniref:hypothetical protein n=1 Tax=Brevibacillus sp. 7WMA2 TaxID=2683193 RepID=UPI0013A77B60|nr:hypothetical protein [Brevibacillus sp. 7WMA2]QIC07641.1 hypothetical protein GOP56_19950 [Brevibacillus sp. 7WMA2]